MPEFCRRTITEGHPPVICPVFEEGAILPPGLTDEQRLCLTQGQLAKDYSMGISVSPPWWRGLATDWSTFWKYQILKYSSVPLSTATRSAMGATLSGGSKWYGGILGPDGKIYGIPFNSINILIIDPIAGTATRSAMGADLSGSSKWIGGLLGPDGKIYGIPYSSTDILIIDPIAGTATRSAMGATLSDSYKWYGGILGLNGKIYGIPYNSTDILIIDGSEAKLQWMLKGPYLNKL